MNHLAINVILFFKYSLQTVDDIRDSTQVMQYNSSDVSSFYENDNTYY